MEASESSGAVRAARVLRLRTSTHCPSPTVFPPPMQSPVASVAVAEEEEKHKRVSLCDL